VPHPPEKQPKADAGLLTFLNPVPTAWFQSINALGIFVLAPVFAFWWTYNERRGRGTSIAFKIVFGVLLLSVALLFLLAAVWYERQPTEAKLADLPPGIELKDGKLWPQEPGTVYHTGRLTFDRESGKLSMRGALADTERDRMVRDSAPGSFKEIAAVLEKVTPDLEKGKTQTVEVEVPRNLDLPRWLLDSEVVPVAKKADASAGDRQTFKVTAELPLRVRLPETPPGFDLRLAEFNKGEVTYDAASKTLTVNNSLADKDIKSLLVAAGEPNFRQAVYSLYSDSSKHRVSSWWLFWFYVVATVGELYLSPVGLSMVSKLAPVRYATMLMGLWLLTSFFGNFLAGMAGEYYDKIPPGEFFLYLFIIVLAVALAGFLIVRRVTALMHGVK
jgi:POT family proton-dependent oligopeptide transporter